MSDTTNLIRRFHAGEPQAFAEIIAAYKDDVYTVCLRMLGPNRAESGAETIFLEAHQAMYRLHADTDLDAWMLRRTVEYTLRAELPTDDVGVSMEEKSSLVQNSSMSWSPHFVLRSSSRTSSNYQKTRFPQFLIFRWEPLGAEFIAVD